MKRRSHAKASIAPPAIACPVTAATVGIGKVKTRSMLRPKATIVRLSSSGGSVGRTFRLRPAEKTPARPAITSAPGRSRSARSRAVFRPSKNASAMAFTLPSSSVIWATSSETP